MLRSVLEWILRTQCSQAGCSESVLPDDAELWLSCMLLALMSCLAPLCWFYSVLLQEEKDSTPLVVKCSTGMVF